MGLPIRHRLDHKMVYISMLDGAWKNDIVDAELKAIDDKIERARAIAAGEDVPEESPDAEVIPWETREDHPITRYRNGSSRYDLRTVEEYLIEGVTPIEFELRRMTLTQWTDVNHLFERGRIFEAGNMAIRHSLVTIRGVLFKFNRRKTTDSISDEDLNDLREMIQENEFRSLGFACINANSPPSVDEKKA